MEGYFTNLSVKEINEKKKNIKMTKELVEKGEIEKAIELSKKRPTTEKGKKPSSWITLLREKYGDVKLPSQKLAKLTGISLKNQRLIIKKGMGAFLTSGSRSTVSSPHAWGIARLASVIMGGKARDVDKDLLN